MHVTLFKALKSANIKGKTAQLVVDAVERHIDLEVKQATQTLEAKLAAMDATLKSEIGGLKTSMEALKWWIVGVGSLLVIAGGILTSATNLLK